MNVPSPEAAEIVRRKKSMYGLFADTKQWSRFEEIALPNVQMAFRT
jgi:hypothetical protein